MTINTGPRARHIDIVFDKPPGPVCPGFIEVEDDMRRSINFGAWTLRPDGHWALRITPENITHWFGPIGPPESVMHPVTHQTKYGK